MIAEIWSLLALMLLLQIKHMFGDYFLQTRGMLDGRETYLHLGRFLHGGVHAAGTALAFTLIGTPLPFTLLAALADWAIHFHIDWWKGRLTMTQKLTPADSAYWRASGVDQALHQLTYVAMIWVWLLFSYG
ncbi:DUF3307 domain-containing protein [Sulfitobacter sp. LCG007]